MKSKATFLMLFFFACAFGKTFGQADPGCGGLMFSKTIYQLNEQGELQVVIGNFSSGFKTGSDLSPYDATFTVTIPPILQVSGEIDFSDSPFPVTIVSQMMNALGSTIIVFTAPKGISKGGSGMISIPVMAYKTDVNILYATVKTEVNLSYPPSGNLIPSNDMLATPVYVITPLPVTLSSFEVNNENFDVNLAWTTTSESNSERFDVERSLDGKNWLNIGTVLAMENSVDKSYYSFQDVSPLEGNNYYRLKMVDKDQTYAYSSIRTIKLGEVELSLFPNPVSDMLNIRMSGWDKVNVLQLFNMKGEMVHNESEDVHKAIDVSHLSKGSYIVKIGRTDGFLVTKQIWINR